MSCHSIGHGLNTVAKTTMELYMNNKITMEDTKVLLRQIQKAVHYCDGNEYEAIEYLIDNDICSACLEEKEEELIILYDSEYKWFKGDIYREYEEDTYYVSMFICRECMEEYKKKINLPT